MIFLVLLTINCDKRDIDFLPEVLTTYYSETLYNVDSFDLKHFEQREGNYYVLFAEKDSTGVKLWSQAFDLKGRDLGKRPFDISEGFD